MSRPAISSTLLVGALCLIAACSKSPSSTGNNATSNSAHAVTPAAATIPPGTVCDSKLLGADDLGGIFDEPITGTKPLQGDAQTCYFTTARDNKLRVTLRPGSGIAVIGSFTSGHMDQFAKWQPLAGVGEEAIWKPDLTEVSARNGDVLCEIAPEAGSLFLAKALKNGDEMAKQRKFGGLCNTIFARLQLPGAAAMQTTPIGKSNGGNVVETACEKNITPADVADIISAPVTKLSGFGPQSCSYHASAGATVTISLSSGDDGKFAWNTMSNPANTGALSPLAGIGDTALHARGGTLVIARKGDLVCSVDITGTDNADGMQVITKARGEELAKKLGALCGKVFAAR
jgi:hypothetical protein